ncbi:MAG TPA: SMI1/KNR4 family protein, partial [Thermomonospora sp.]|nr:SMI1/KNR4 family protein [Thermomonospora sp.]
MRNERDERLAGLFAPLAAAVHAAAPPDWSAAVLRAYATPFQGGATVTYRTPGGRERRRAEGVTAELDTLVELAKGPGAGLDVELTVEPGGSYEGTVTPRSKRGLSGGTCILDPGYGFRQAGFAQEGPADATEAGDPDEAVRLMEEYRRRRARILGGRAPEPQPVPAARIDELEDLLGTRLPADLRALYERAGHTPDGFYWEWLPADEVEAGGVRSRYGSGPILDAEPPDTVRRVSDHTGWISFAYDGDGNYLAVDMAPARAGRPGQVIAVGDAYSDGPAYVADSVTALLRRQL